MYPNLNITDYHQDMMPCSDATFKSPSMARSCPSGQRPPMKRSFSDSQPSHNVWIQKEGHKQPKMGGKMQF